MISGALLLIAAVDYMSAPTECYMSTHALSDIKTIQMSLTQYKVRNGHVLLGELGLRGLVNDRIIDEASLIDPWGTPYGYREPTEHTKAGIYSCGEDKRSSTFGNDADDLNSWNSTEAYYKARRPIFVPGDAWQIVGVASLVGFVIAACTPHRTRSKVQNQAAPTER
jgi:hypothetical protein